MSTPGAKIPAVNRGLGLAPSEEWARRGWHVAATVRSAERTGLHDLADRYRDKIEIERVDITVPERIAALHSRLAQRTFDLLFVNAGVTNQPEGTLAEASTEEFVRVMVTDALGPLRVIEALQDHVEPTGTIGVMSSRSLVVMASGWVQTEMGGPNARLSINDSIPNVVKTIDALRNSPGLHYVDYRGQTVPW